MRESGVILASFCYIQSWGPLYIIHYLRAASDNTFVVVTIHCWLLVKESFGTAQGDDGTIKPITKTKTQASTKITDTMPTFWASRFEVVQSQIVGTRLLIWINPSMYTHNSTALYSIFYLCCPGCSFGNTDMRGRIRSGNDRTRPARTSRCDSVKPGSL